MYPYNMLRWTCAASIATGAVMHASGLYLARSISFDQPWWMSLIFWTAIVGYSASAVGILFRRREAAFFAVLGPVVGGSLICRYSAARSAVAWSSSSSSLA